MSIIEYSAQFFKFKMMLKYSLRTIHKKVAEKGFKMNFMMNKLAMINSCEIILEIFFAKNHCEIKVCTKIVCALKLYAHYTR